MPDAGDTCEIADSARAASDPVAEAMRLRTTSSAQVDYL
jgi:hypothetical protein